MSADQLFSDFDAKIASRLEPVGLLNSARLPGVTDPVDGYYNSEFVEDGSGEDSIAGFYKSFDCRASAVPARIEPDDVIEVIGFGRFRFVRSEPYGNGRIILVLGTQL